MVNDNFICALAKQKRTLSKKQQEGDLDKCWMEVFHCTTIIEKRTHTDVSSFLMDCDLLFHFVYNSFESLGIVNC